MTTHALGVSKLERGDREERFQREAGRDRFWRFNKPFCIRMGGRESAERLRSPGPKRRRGAHELKKFFACVNWKSVGGVRNDVRVMVLAQMEADGHASWSGPHGVIVGNGWQTGRI